MNTCCPSTMFRSCSTTKLTLVPAAGGVSVHLRSSCPKVANLRESSFLLVARLNAESRSLHKAWQPIFLSLFRLMLCPLLQSWLLTIAKRYVWHDHSLSPFLTSLNWLDSTLAARNYPWGRSKHSRDTSRVPEAASPNRMGEFCQGHEDSRWGISTIQRRQSICPWREGSVQNRRSALLFHWLQECCTGIHSPHPYLGLPPCPDSL